MVSVCSAAKKKLVGGGGGWGGSGANPTPLAGTLG